MRGLSTIGINLYLNELKKESGSKCSIEAAVYGLNWKHEMAGLVGPTSHLLVHAALEGTRRQLGKPRVKKEPVTPEMLQSWLRSLVAGMLLLLTYVGCLFVSWGMLRSYDMMRLRVCDSVMLRF